MQKAKKSGTAIYALRDTRCGSIRYIGQTALEPSKRLKSHIAAARHFGPTSPLRQWITDAAERGELELLLLAEDCADPDIEERVLIDRHAGSGALLNSRRGGKRPSLRSHEALKREVVILPSGASFIILCPSLPEVRVVVSRPDEIVSAANRAIEAALWTQRLSG